MFSTGRSSRASHSGAYSAKNTAQLKAMGTAMINAPNATQRVLANIGAIPNWIGSKTGLHSLPEIKASGFVICHMGRLSRSIKRNTAIISKLQVKAITNETILINVLVIVRFIICPHDIKKTVGGKTPPTRCHQKFSCSEYSQDLQQPQIPCQT